MSSDYKRIFEQRGLTYNAAMQAFPRARDAEFAMLFDSINTASVSIAADVPSGGGYLQPHLPKKVTVDAFEPCDEFKTHQHGSPIDLENLSLEANRYDLVVSLAALHHVSNKQLFMQRCYEGLKPFGYLCIADVPANHSIGRFLDDFAGLHNGTGHSGDYLQVDQTELQARNQGFTVINSQVKYCPWVFANQDDMLTFCRGLFSLSNVDQQMLLEALDHYVGISTYADKVILNWELLYLSLQKN